MEAGKFHVVKLPWAFLCLCLSSCYCFSLELKWHCSHRITQKTSKSPNTRFNFLIYPLNLHNSYVTLQLWIQLKSIQLIIFFNYLLIHYKHHVFFMHFLCLPFSGTDSLKTHFLILLSRGPRQNLRLLFHLPPWTKRSTHIKKRENTFCSQQNESEYFSAR